MKPTIPTPPPGYTPNPVPPSRQNHARANPGYRSNSTPPRQVPPNPTVPNGAAPRRNPSTPYRPSPTAPPTRTTAPPPRNAMPPKPPASVPPKKEERHPFRLRFLSIVMLLAILFTGGVTTYCSYHVIWKPVAAANAGLAGKTDQQIANGQLREEQEQQEEMRRDSGQIVYTPTLEETGDLDLVITDESDALEALIARQTEMGIYDAQESYSCTGVRTNAYFETYTMRQYYQGIEVYGRAIKVTADTSGNLVSIDGTYESLDGFDTTVSRSESDAYDYVERYLKNTYQVTDAAEIYTQGSRILFDETDAPLVAYYFQVLIYGTETEMAQYRYIFVDANTCDILYDELAISMEMVTLDQDSPSSPNRKLEGQLGSQSLDVIKHSDDEYQLADDERGIYIYRQVMNDYDWDAENTFRWDPNTGTVDASAVDALANLQKVYDFYLDNFSRYGVHNSTDQALSVFMRVPGMEGNAGMTHDGNSIYIGDKAADAEADLGAYLDVMGHEFLHGIMREECGLYLDNHELGAAEEGLADIFGELIQDYSDGGFDNSCDWIVATEGYARNITAPQNPSKESDEGYLTNYSNFYTASGDPTEVHLASTLASYPAYLMTQGINGTEALGTEQLANLYYYAIMKVNGGEDFATLRAKIEQNALSMNRATYDLGPYRNANDDAMAISDAQFECVVDAMDRVGISRMYDYSLVPNATLTVTDLQDLPYSNYHLEIRKQSNNSTVVDVDVLTETYELPNLEKGVYTFVLTDLNNEDLAVVCSVMINDNAQDQCGTPYEESTIIPTRFGAEGQEVALVLDTSGSMDGEPIQETRQAALNFVETVFRANPAIRVTLISYSTNAEMLLESCNDPAELTRAINGLYSGGDTYMCEALSMAQEVLNTDRDSSYLILMSDGLPHDDPEPIAQSIRDDDVILCSLGFYQSSDEGSELMRQLASPGYNYNVQDVSTLQDLFTEIGRQVSGVRYSRSVIDCPVDVTVTYNGETLSSAEGDQNLITSFGSITFEGEDNETKILRLDESVDYEICITGYDKGTMDYSISYMDENGDYTDTREFRDIPIRKKTMIATTSASAEETVLNVDSDGDGKFDVSYYNDGSGDEATTYSRVVRTRILIVSILVLVLLVGLEALLITLRYKKNKRCPSCKSEVRRGVKFCAKCGTTMQRVPLIFPKKIQRKKEAKGVKIAKLCIIGLCALLSTGVIMTYRSAAGTVLLQLRDQKYASAQWLYERGVEDTKIGKWYLSTVTNLYLEKVNTAYLNQEIDANAATTLYQTVAEMDMGTASESAEHYLSSLADTDGTVDTSTPAASDSTETETTTAAQ